jgi:hypothetical protein
LLDLRCSGSDTPAVMRYRKSSIQIAPTRRRSPPARAGSFYVATSTLDCEQAKVWYGCV